MSTGIEIKIWFRDRSEPLEKTFAQMVRAVASSPHTSGPWTNFCVQAPSRSSRLPLFKVQEALSIHHLTTLIEQKQWEQKALGKGKRLSGELAASSLSADTCFQYKAGNEDTSMGMTITGWDRTAFRGQEDWWWEGDASIYLWRLWPFVKTIEQNIDLLLDFLAQLIKQIEPGVIKVFNEDHTYFLLNAHLAYYRDETSVVADLEFLFHLWEHGLASLAIPPLKACAAFPLRELDYQGKEDAAQRWKQFQKLLFQKATFSKEHLHQALSANNLDIYRLPVGYLVLSTYPNCFMASLDDFYALLLEKCNANADR